VGVWADAGVAETTMMKTKMQATILLCILELYTIPDFEFVYPVRVDFQDISGWFVWSVSWPPGACQDCIHDNLLGIYPDDCQVHENE
jgi:hypothetical protein